MYHVLLILLHRPFVADGHLFSTMRTASVNAFMSCATAASEIVRLVRIYHQAFSVKRAPYLISYATYVAATVHVRIAATRETSSGAYASLETCLAVFMENSETNSAVQRASAIVKNLMTRLGVTIPEGHRPEIGDASIREPPLAPPADNTAAMRRTSRRVGPSVTSQSPITPQTDASPGQGSTNLDIDQIIQNFNMRTDNPQFAQPMQWRGQMPGDTPSSDHHGSDMGMAGMSTGPAFGTPGGHHNMVTPQPPYYGYYGWPATSDNTTFAGPGAVDDPLFGFNGAALDPFTHPGGMFYMGDM